MTERRALGLIYLVSVALVVLLMFGLAAIGDSGEMFAFGFMAILCGGAWAVAAVTGHDGDDD